MFAGLFMKSDNEQPAYTKCMSYIRNTTFDIFYGFPKGNDISFDFSRIVYLYIITDAYGRKNNLTKIFTEKHAFGTMHYLT